MWAFERFPSKIRYDPEMEDATTYEVEVFGYIETNTVSGVYFDTEPPTLNRVQLVVFRLVTHSAYTMTSDMQMLPVNEFEHHFENYELVKE